MRVPVLCYHRIETPPAGFEKDSNFVTPSRFAEHIGLLASFGFTGVTVRDIARWQRGEMQLPERPVAITFDDAYTSVTDHAIPLLNARAWKSSVFVVTSQIGGTNAWDVAAPPASLMCADVLRALNTAGHEIGSHTHQHRRIKGLETRTALDELIASHDALRSLIGADIHSFAFPYGSHDAITLEMVRAAGYQASVTLKRWANTRHGNPFRIGRISVGGQLPAWQLAMKLMKMMLTPEVSRMRKPRTHELAMLRDARAASTGT
jgi:peptidoglycan/xylan/chitin deacetylase (PgdA/CDA1 family)